MTVPTPDPRTVGGVLRARVAADPDREFLVCDDERLTYRQLLADSTPLARALVAAGVGRGSHVGLLLPNGEHFALLAVAIMRIGAVAVPLSTLSSAAELRTLCDRSDISVLVAAAEFRGRRFDELLADALGLPAPADPVVRSTHAPNLRRVVFTGDDALAVGGDLGWRHDSFLAAGSSVPVDLVEALEAGVRPSDPVVIVHTSGSTSAPKGVVHAHGGLVDHLHVLNELRAHGPGEVLFSNSPFFWIGGFAYTFLATMLAGATVLCSREADPARVLDLLEREQPTSCNGYAASASALAADPSFPDRDLSSMRRGNLYSIMPAHAVPADPSHRTGMLGLTEGGSVVMTASASEADTDLPEDLHGSFGRPTPDLEARVVDPSTGTDVVRGERGELWLRGPGLMLGYHGVERSRAFDADGWFHTGDLVHRHPDVDHWFFHGRGDDMIKTAGANVSPAEVQDAVRAAIGLDSIVLGLPDRERGAVVAVVLLVDRADQEAPDVAQLRRSLEPMLSTYKLPRVVHAMSSADVPLRSSGKVDLTSLRENISDIHA